jgi:hypothetical protein
VGTIQLDIAAGHDHILLKRCRSFTQVPLGSIGDDLQRWPTRLGAGHRGGGGQNGSPDPAFGGGKMD